MISPILDRSGKPFEAKKEILSEEITRAYTTSIRNPQPESVASMLTPQRLAGLLRSVVDGGNPEQYMILAEEMEERDLHYAAQLRTRKLVVAAIMPTVEAVSDAPADAAMAERVRAILHQDAMPELFFDLLDGLGKGIGVSETLWNTNKTPWTPQAYKWVDPRYLRPDQETLQEILLISDEAPYGAPLEPYKFIVHTPRSKSGSVWRNGLARLVAVMYMLKSYTLRDWWSFAEVFGIPIRIGKYGPNATKEDIATLINAIGKISSDAGAAIPDSMKMEIIESGAAKGGDILFESMARWCDEQISKAVLGQTMTSDNGSSRSQAEVHNEVREDIADWDARQLEATINDQLIKPYIILNWGVQEHYPRVKIRLPKPEDLKAFVDAIVPMIDRGFKVSSKQVYDKFGLKPPEDGDDVLVPQGSLTPVYPSVETALNRSTRPVAMNRAQTNVDTEIDDMTDETMADWIEVGGDEFMNPILEAAKSVNSFEEFQALLPELQKGLTAEQFTEQLARMMFQSRALGDVNDV
jgi:phage gp29-like protein